MKFKLKKSSQAGQKRLADAIRKGLPLAGLFAVMPLTGGCEKDTPYTPIVGDVPATTAARRPVLRGDIAPQPIPPSTPQNQKREFVPEVPPLAGAPLPPPERKLKLPKETQVYIVKSGDTLLAIAKRYDVPLEVITELNQFSREQANKLRVGQKILLPKSANLKNETPGVVVIGEMKTR